MEDLKKENSNSYGEEVLKEDKEEESKTTLNKVSVADVDAQRSCSYASSLGSFESGIGSTIVEDTEESKAIIPTSLPAYTALDRTNGENHHSKGGTCTASFDAQPILDGWHDSFAAPEDAEEFSGHRRDLDINGLADGVDKDVLLETMSNPIFKSLFT